jgi:hypothetical protein
VGVYDQHIGGVDEDGRIVIGYRLRHCEGQVNAVRRFLNLEEIGWSARNHRLRPGGAAKGQVKNGGAGG